MQSSRQAPRDREAARSAPHSFRAAFSQARLEGRCVGVEIVGEHGPPGPGADAPQLGTYEVRIEKRSGKRSSDLARWNKLGREGWKLVSVVGKQAFFRRDHPPS
jgi:hypothetical protein